MYLKSAPAHILDKIRGFVHGSIRAPGGDKLKHLGSTPNLKRRELCDWIHRDGGV